MNPLRPCLLGVLSGALLTLTAISAAAADAHFTGAKSCQECHTAEYGVWEASKHSLSFKDLHRRPNFKAILDAAGGDKNPRKNTLCVQCHYTPEQDSPTATANVRTSVSCENCHGRASEWRLVHNDYGGPGVTRESEPAAHKTERIEKSVALGLIRPGSLYDLAANCLDCHTLARPGLDPAVIGKMIAAGHPINPDYELVRYSQGTVRHRFYPPDTKLNATLDSAALSRHYVIGRAAMLVTASEVSNTVSEPAFKDAVGKQLASARAALNALKDVPEAAALVASPTEANARKLAAAIAGKDLTAQVGSMLPAAADYK